MLATGKTGLKIQPSSQLRDCEVGGGGSGWVFNITRRTRPNPLVPTTIRRKVSLLIVHNSKTQRGKLLAPRDMDSSLYRLASKTHGLVPCKHTPFFRGPGVAHAEGGLFARLCHGLHHHLHVLTEDASTWHPYASKLTRADVAFWGLF